MHCKFKGYNPGVDNIRAGSCMSARTLSLPPQPAGQVGTFIIPHGWHQPLEYRDNGDCDGEQGRVY